MRIATYNVNGVNGRLPVLLRWLANYSPDVVCLQELKAPAEKFPETSIRALGYECLWHGQMRWNGVAILARAAKLRETHRGLPGDPEDVHSRYIEADLGGLVVASLYLPNGNPQPGPKFDYKLKWFARLIEHASALCARAQPVILAGDYNVVPTNDPCDIYSPNSWLNDALLQPETRDAYRRLLAQGWIDAIHHLHPAAPMYTFWDYFRNRWERNAGLRIDHLLLNPAAAQRLTQAGVDRAVRGREKPSDHAPAWVSLRAAS